MIRIDEVTLSKSSVSVNEQFKIEVSVTEVFPTWNDTRPHKWQFFIDKTWGAMKNIIYKGGQ